MAPDDKTAFQAPPRLPRETDAQYAARLRKLAASRAKRPDETDEAHAARVAKQEAKRTERERLRAAVYAEREVAPKIGRPRVEVATPKSSAKTFARSNDDAEDLSPIGVKSNTTPDVKKPTGFPTAIDSVLPTVADELRDVPGGSRETLSNIVRLDDYRADSADGDRRFYSTKQGVIDLSTVDQEAQDYYARRRFADSVSDNVSDSDSVVSLEGGLGGGLPEEEKGVYPPSPRDRGEFLEIPEVAHVCKNLYDLPQNAVGAVGNAVGIVIPSTAEELEQKTRAALQAIHSNATPEQLDKMVASAIAAAPPPRKLTYEENVAIYEAKREASLAEIPDWSPARWQKHFDSQPKTPRVVVKPMQPGEEDDDLLSCCAWPIDKDVVFPGVSRDAFLVRSYQLLHITDGPIPLTAEDWNDPPAEIVTVLVEAYELALAAALGNEEGADRIYTQVASVHACHPTLDVSKKKSERLLRAEQFLSDVGELVKQPRPYVFGRKNSWSRRTIYARWMAMIGLPFELGVLTERCEWPPGFDVSEALGYGVRDADRSGPLYAHPDPHFTPAKIDGTDGAILELNRRYPDEPLDQVAERFQAVTAEVRGDAIPIPPNHPAYVGDIDKRQVPRRPPGSERAG